MQFFYWNTTTVCALCYMKNTDDKYAGFDLGQKSKSIWTVCLV